jgi:nucleotide-binding universal stress UspA family protein
MRRILVALDALPHHRSVLEAAADLAARLQAELEGVFVEDVLLLRTAESPLAGEVSPFSATARRMNVRQVERQMRVQARRMQRLFERVLARSEVPGSFRVRRGVVVRELVSEASGADVLILGRGSWSPTGSERLSRVTRAVLAEAPAPVLVLRRGTRLEQPMAVLYDGSPLSEEALGTGASLARADDERLTVLVLGADGAQARRLQAQAAAQLGDAGLQVRYLLLEGVSLRKVLHVLQREPVGALILPARSERLAREEIVTLLDRVSMPTFVVR